MDMSVKMVSRPGSGTRPGPIETDTDPVPEGVLNPATVSVAAFAAPLGVWAASRRAGHAT